MHSLTKPDANMLARIKTGAIAQLAHLGLITPFELPALALAHVDDVLDRVFLHCAVIRVRVADDRWIEIHPNGSVH